ncbi:MAG: tRNA pseudouridine(55) synthase TruB [Spirochaetota bacterium]|nr:tRNA pseudouridine(55) synthase TruB [Spirochaetota bacterium]
MDSVLLIDKSVGKTSYQTISELKRLLKIQKAGHSGTLDKFASGLLVVCTGWTTRLANQFLNSDKRYIGEVRLGIVTDTYDIEGKIIERQDCTGLSYDRILQIKKRFTGEMLQLPPKYSAIKIGGRRASDLAREGREVELKERKIFIKELNIQKFDLDNSIITIDVLCSKGTYIRSLAKDIGEFLGTGAYLQSLRRVASGSFSVENAVTLSQLTEHVEGNIIDKTFHYNPVEALSGLSSIIVKDSIRHRIINGAYFRRGDVIEINNREDNPFMILDENKNLIAIADIDISNWKIEYKSVFNKG